MPFQISLLISPCEGSHVSKSNGSTNIRLQKQEIGNMKNVVSQSLAKLKGEKSGRYRKSKSL